jgi:hypothetical protein
VDDASVYWTNEAFGGPGGVMKVAKTGGTPVTLAAGAPFGIALDATDVYWTDGFGVGTVMKVPVGGGTPTTLATGTVNPQPIAVNAADVYWTDDNGLMKVPLKGGAVVTLAHAGGAAMGSLALDSANVYWMTAAGLLKVALGGGAVTTLAPPPTLAVWGSDATTPATVMGIAVDATTVYWGTWGCYGSLLSVPIAGGSPTTIDANRCYPQGVVVAGTSLYWAEQYTPGVVMRLTPK